MSNSIFGTKPITKNTDVIEIDMDLDQFASLTGVSPRALRGNGRFDETSSPVPARKPARQTAIAGQVPRIEVQHPLLNFINELCGQLSECSERYLRPMPSFGLIKQAREPIDFSELLKSLEGAEKKFNLLSHGKPGLDALTNASRHLAHTASLFVRGVRRSLITTTTDPAHPSEAHLPEILADVDALAHNLHEIRLNFEDLAANLFIQARLEGAGPASD